MKKIITSLILLFGVLSTLFAANVTLYYVNSTKWATVNGYVWNKASDTPLTAWPGATMTKTSETAKGFDVYSITFDAAKYDRIIFKGTGQTADLTFNASKPYYYEGAWYATLAEINGADAPAELTLYYVNTTKWSKVFAYAWGNTALADWPGVAATLAGRTKDGIEVYSYTFNPTMANQIIFNNGNGSQTKDLPINAATPYFYNNNWVASFAYDPVPVEPTPVLDPIYLRGNVNAWGIDDNWKLTTTDGNYFVANYAAGSEVELSGSFKLGSGTTDWAPYNFGADIEVEAGKSYVLTAGSNSPNINTSGKIKVSKIEFTLSTQTLKITGQTVADKFDITTDQGIALVENLDGTLQYIPLEFQANGVYTGVYTFAKSAKSMPLFKVGGTADLNTIDFGDNGTSIIRLDQPYTLKRGSSNFVAINQTDLGSQGVDNGTKFDVTVTFTEDWGVTLLFVKQADPVVAKITNLSVDAFANTTINKTSIVNASYYLYYADEAVPTISGEDAAYFTLSDITLSEEFFNQDGEPMRGGHMIITFAPTEGRQYKATLTITSGDVSESIALIATGVALPVEAITNLTIPAFANTEVYASSVVTATYTLENATQATAKLTGDNAFSIVEQAVSNGQGAVTISFTPVAAGTYSGTLIITSGKASQSIDFTATATAPETDERVATLYIQERDCNPIAIYVYGSETATTPEGDAKTGVKDDKLHLHGYDMYKITLNLKKTKYVSLSDKGYNKQAIEPGSTWYYDKGWNDNFDECRYDVALEDLTKQPEAGKIYAVGAYLAFYSAEYGPEFMYNADRTEYDATIKGVTYYSYNIDASVYDMARVEGGDDYSIDWSKPYYYDGNWYATMAQIPVADNLVEKAYWSFGLSRDGNYESGVYPTTHMGNNIYTGKFHISIGIDKPYQWKAQIKAGPNYAYPCHEEIYADAVVPEQAGYYEVSVQYNATTNQYTAQWELEETNVSVKFLDKTNVMEIAELNNYTFRCFTKIAKGLYYYNINDKNHDLTTEETLVQIPEDGVYNITFSYDATTGKFSHTVEKAPSKEITLYYVNENTNVDCAYAFAYAWIQYSGDCVAAYPGEEMTDTGKTVDGYQVLSYTVDLAEADYILFNNTICGDKTADLAIDPAKPYYYQGEWHESLTFDEAPTGETTLYYVNKMGITDTEWDYAFAYAYDNATGTPIVEWPGAPMGKLTKTIDGYDVFACTVDLSKADYIVFTNGQGGSLSKTMDLEIEPLKPYYYQLIWHGKLTFDDGTTEPGEILDPVLPDHEPIYLRGVVNNWGVDENYKLTSIDGIRYSVTYAPGSEIELYGNFKLASGNDTWYPFNFGAYPTKPIITAGQDFVALRDASENIQVDGKILVSKIEFNLDTYTLKITGETQKFDMTSDQGVSVVVYVGEESTFIPLTFTQNGTYTGSFTVTDADFSLKIAGTSDYNTINYGTNGTSAKFAYLYALQQGAFESITIDDEYEVGDVINVWVAFEEDWSAIMNLNRQAPMPDDGYEPLYLRGGVTSWAADENYKLTTIDGNYYSAYYEAGSEVEITGAFKIASGSEDWAPYNFGGNFLVKAGENYILQSGGGDLEADGKIIASRIEFFMETKTLKITGVTQENKFDVTTDQGVSLAVNINEETTFIPLTFTQNGTYTGSYTVTDLDFMFKVGGEADFNTINYGTNGTPLILGTPYTLHKNSFGAIAIADDIQVGDVLDVVVSIAEDWITASMLVTQKAVTPDPGPEPEPEPEPDTYTPIYVMGGINGWVADDNYKLTSTDGNYYVATYPAGSEVEISGAFKVADESWKIYNFGGAGKIEAGKEYVLIAGNNSANLEAVGKIMASKIEFTVSTATLVITGTTEENLFDITTDQGISLVQFLGTEPT
ncbi:MAG: starch-binding protein, partial [Paludibacteraceae bacterium]|nr:starch-binding protein [Paludibacteraceae bacterium]